MILTKITRQKVGYTTDDVTGQKIPYYTDAEKYWGNVAELSATEVVSLGRTLSEATAKCIINNRPEISESDRIYDPRSGFTYSITGINQDYVKDETICYIKRYLGAIRK